MHTGATIRRVNHFTNDTINGGQSWIRTTEPEGTGLQPAAFSLFANYPWRLVVDSNHWNNYSFGSLANCWFKPTHPTKQNKLSYLVIKCSSL